MHDSDQEQDDNGGDLRFVEKRLEPVGLPIVIKSRRRRPALATLTAIALMFGIGGPCSMMQQGTMSEAKLDQSLRQFMVLDAVVATVLVVAWSWRRALTVDREGARMRRRVLCFPVGSWFEPMDHYEGLRYWVQVVTTGSGRRGTRRTLRIHTITLAHRNPRRCVNLLETTYPGGPMEQVCEDYARLLGVAVLQSVGGHAFKRSPEDLDKTLWQLIGEGKVATEKAAEDPPEKVASTSTQDARIITVDRGHRAIRENLPFIAIPTLVCGLPFAFLVGMVWAKGFDWELVAPITICGGMYAVCIVGTAVSIRKGRLPFRMVIGRTDIRFGHVNAKGEFVVAQSVELERIEGISYGCAGNVTFALSDGHSVSTKTLGAEPGEWLCKTIMATVLELRPDLKEVGQGATKRETR